MHWITVSVLTTLNTTGASGPARTKETSIRCWRLDQHAGDAGKGKQKPSRRAHRSQGRAMDARRRTSARWTRGSSRSAAAPGAWAPRSPRARRPRSFSLAPAPRSSVIGRSPVRDALQSCTSPVARVPVIYRVALRAPPRRLARGARMPRPHRFARLLSASDRSK